MVPLGHFAPTEQHHLLSDRVIRHAVTAAGRRPFAPLFVPFTSRFHKPKYLGTRPPEPNRQRARSAGELVESPDPASRGTQCRDRCEPLEEQVYHHSEHCPGDGSTLFATDASDYYRKRWEGRLRFSTGSTRNSVSAHRGGPY